MKIPSSSLKQNKISASCKMLALAALSTVCSMQTSSAALMFDLRATDTAGLTSGTKSTEILPGANVITLDLWMVATGNDAVATNDGLLSINGIMIISGGAPTVGGISLDPNVLGNTAILSAPNALRGNLAPFNTGQGNQKVGLIAPWDTSSTSNGGIARDLNGDGFTDIGGTTSTATGNGFIVANAGATQNAASGLAPITNFNLLANGVEFRLARYTFTIANGLAGQAGGVNVAAPLFSALNNNSRASWTRDGTASVTGAAANISVGAPVVLTVVPEPSAFGMVLLGMVGLLSLRRLGLRNA